MTQIVILGNGNDWCELSLSNCTIYDNVKMVNTALPYNPKRWLSRLCKLHYSQTIEKYIELPFKTVWFPYFANYICKNRDANLILIIYDRNRLANNTRFLKYLKRRYSKISLVYMFTNIVKISGALKNDYVDVLNKIYDRVYAFDPSDAPKYGFYYHPLLYSKNLIDDTADCQNVFYVGRAKDRFAMLMQVYARLEQLGISKKFFVFGVPENEQIHKDKITYNKLISYYDCLKYIQNSDCLVDVIQGESEGFTIKVCEAIFYNKLLITTNESIKNAPFYNEKWILVIKSPQDITSYFFKNAKNVDYSQKDRDFFSAQVFVKELEKDLSK